MTVSIATRSGTMIAMTTSNHQLSLREALERWLDKRSVDLAESTISEYWYRLKHFVEWSEDGNLETMSEITPWDAESYEAHRRAQGVKPLTLRKEMFTFRDFLNYCDRIGITPDDIGESVDPPKVDKYDQVCDAKLEPDDGEALLRYFRGHDELRGSNYHAFFELVWFTSARMGGIRSLDIDHVDFERGRLTFHHRPDQGLPLKKGYDGERILAIPPKAIAVVEEYYNDPNRPDDTDQFGNKPLLTTTHGRASLNTLRNWMYYSTVPCRLRECPHNEHPDTCDWYTQSKSYGCPSSLSPHPVRAGSITWQRNRGVPREVVAERSNASEEVLELHYDQPSKEEALEERRLDYVQNINLDMEDDDDE